MGGNIKYKDSVFTLLFGEKDKLIELYNAISGTNYTSNVNLEITTLQDALFLDRKNDISFVIDDKFVVLIEHQSTINENMPLRCLLYIARVYEKIIRNDNIYREKLIKIPTPEFIVCYNGRDKYDDEKILRLSDAFKDKNKFNLELTVKIVNVKKDHNPVIVKKSRTLEEYSLFIDKVEEYRAADSDLNKALDNAIKYCIGNNILKEFLTLHGSEVINMLYVDFDMEVAKRIWREEAREDGLEEGIKEGKKEGMKEGIKEGIKEGKKEGMKEGKELGKKEIALNLLRENLPIDLIIKATGLTRKKVTQLKENL